MSESLRSCPVLPWKHWVARHQVQIREKIDNSPFSNSLRGTQEDTRWLLESETLSLLLFNHLSTSGFDNAAPASPLLSSPAFIKSSLHPLRWLCLHWRLSFWSGIKQKLRSALHREERSAGGVAFEDGGVEQSGVCFHDSCLHLALKPAPHLLRSQHDVWYDEKAGASERGFRVFSGAMAFARGGHRLKEPSDLLHKDRHSQQDPGEPANSQENWNAAACSSSPAEDVFITDISRRKRSERKQNLPRLCSLRQHQNYR